ncbi:hypothetical protein [Metabacillus litoralis]|uniref:hypothetical protein n=1 Tax=Metabacillus litoralis TaxID=152268 RepID=UPI00203D0685|nr:hypothetical protein [Metabacillus litoralis]MCM3651338.1 hypothetical protein [Metabacillus litoralis]
MRPVIADHILFDECISVFRPESMPITDLDSYSGKGFLKGYILLDFPLDKTWDFKYFKVEPTINAELPGVYSAFISPMSIPKWFDDHRNTQLFSIAFSAICSFATGRSIKSPRRDYSSFTSHPLEELILHFPIATSGAEAHDFLQPGKDTDREYFETINDILDVLLHLKYEDYQMAMQSIRLIHLAHLNFREDFGLSYYLLLSGIESVTQKAIKRKSKKHPLENEWVKIAKDNPLIEELLSAYKNERGNNKYLGERVTKFILKYFPPKYWDDYKGKSEFMEKHWNERYPSDLTESELEQMLKDAYKHRSGFTHEGKNPPHFTPFGYNRYFDEVTKYVLKEDGSIEREEKMILPNFKFMSFIARNSILNYLREKMEQIST